MISSEKYQIHYSAKQESCSAYASQLVGIFLLWNLTIHPAVFDEPAAEVPVIVHASRSLQLGVHVSLSADSVPHLLPSPNQPRVPPRDDSPVFESPFDNACGSQVSGVFNDSERLPRVLSAVHY